MDFSFFKPIEGYRIDNKYADKCRFNDHYENIKLNKYG